MGKPVMRTKSYVIDDILLFNPNLEKDGEVYRLECLENIHKIQWTPTVVFVTSDIQSVLFVTDKLLKIVSVFHPLCIIMRGDETKKTVFIHDICKLILRRNRERMSTEGLIKKVTADIDVLGEDYKTNKLKQGKIPLYIKTTMCFGVQSGGAVSHSIGVVSSLRKKYKETHVYTTDYLPPGICDDNVHHVSLQGFNDLFFEAKLYLNISAYKQIVSIEHANTPLFIYQRCNSYDYLGIKIARKYKVPLVLEWNGSDLWVAQKYDGQKLSYLSIAEKIEKLNLENAALITCVSEELKRDLVKKGISEKKIIANANGVDTAKFNPDVADHEIRERYGLEGRIVVGFVGSFAKFHGADILIKAFGELLNNSNLREDVSLLMIGEGNTLPEVKRTVKRLGISEEVIFAGAVNTDSVPKYLAACDVLVAPHVPNEDGSEFFGSPTKLFEYMAMGKAIAASKLNQIGDILKDNETALMFKPGNIGELKMKLEMLIKDNQLRLRLGVNARKDVVQNYTWDKHVDRILARMKELGLI